MFDFKIKKKQKLKNVIKLTVLENKNKSFITRTNRKTDCTFVFISSLFLSVKALNLNLKSIFLNLNP